MIKLEKTVTALYIAILTKKANHTSAGNHSRLTQKRGNEKINDNAYKVDLPGDYEVSATFNVADLSPFIPDFPPQDLRSKLMYVAYGSGK